LIFDFKSFCVDDFDFKIIFCLINDLNHRNLPANHQILQIALQAAEQQLLIYLVGSGLCILGMIGACINSSNPIMNYLTIALRPVFLASDLASAGQTFCTDRVFYQAALRIARYRCQALLALQLGANIWSAGDEVSYIPGKVCQVSAVAC